MVCKVKSKMELNLPLSQGALVVCICYHRLALIFYASVFDSQIRISVGHSLACNVVSGVGMVHMDIMTNPP